MNYCKGLILKAKSIEEVMWTNWLGHPVYAPLKLTLKKYIAESAVWSCEDGMMVWKLTEQELDKHYCECIAETPNENCMRSTNSLGHQIVEELKKNNYSIKVKNVDGGDQAEPWKVIDDFLKEATK